MYRIEIIDKMSKTFSAELVGEPNQFCTYAAAVLGLEALRGIGFEIEEGDYRIVEEE